MTSHAKKSVDPLHLVHEFHVTYGHPVASVPAPTSPHRTRLRLSLIAEEFFELLDASTPVSSPIAKREVQNLIQDEPLDIDLVGTADALADLVYVIYGYALELGIPLSDILEEVHASNMSKLDPTTGLPLYREDGKVLKGSNFREPDIGGILSLT